MIKHLRLLIILLPLFFTSCEKKFIEIVPVTEKVEDLSIPNGRNIRFFSFPTPQVGYAASDTNFIYKTTDGGKSWKQVQFNNSQISKYYKCKKLEFYDDQNGICQLTDLILITNNGGTTWTQTGYSPWGYRNELAGITTDGKAYVCEIVPQYLGCIIKESKDRGKTFKNLVTFNFNEEFITAKVIGSTVFVLDEEGTLYGYNPVTSDTLMYYTGTENGYKAMTDFHFTNWIKVAVGGVIKVGDSEDIHHLKLGYEGDHGYYSVDAYQDFALTVGKNTIVTNMEIEDGERWHKVFDENGNGFNKTFYKIKFIDEHNYYVSGENGLIWKMKI